MALIVEDGSNVANANSYVSLEDAREYASLRGLSLPALPEGEETDGLEALLIRACDYVEGKRDRYKGLKANEDQSLQWPRIDVVIDGIDFSSTAIPKELKAAQVELAVQIYSGVDIMPTRSTPLVVREVVGPIETQYSEKVGVSVNPSFTAVDVLLLPLFVSRGTFLTSVRV